MWEVRAGTNVLVIRGNKEWEAPNIRKHTTKVNSLLDKHELVVDPTGIARWACGPTGCTIGSAYAKAGYYGFRRDGWVLLVKAPDCTYVG